MCRYANKEKEETLGHVMKQRLAGGPQDMGVDDKFCLQSSLGEANDAYRPAVEELQALCRLVAPLKKLECIGKTSFKKYSFVNLRPQS